MENTFIKYDNATGAVTLSWDLWELLSTRTRKHICNVARKAGEESISASMHCVLYEDDILLFASNDIK